MHISDFYRVGPELDAEDTFTGTAHYHNGALDFGRRSPRKTVKQAFFPSDGEDGIGWMATPTSDFCPDHANGRQVTPIQERPHNFGPLTTKK